MEMEIEKLLRGNANDLSNKEEFTEAEKEALQAMSIEEVMVFFPYRQHILMR